MHRELWASSCTSSHLQKVKAFFQHALSHKKRPDRTGDFILFTKHVPRYWNTYRCPHARCNARVEHVDIKAQVNRTVSFLRVDMVKCHFDHLPNAIARWSRVSVSALLSTKRQTYRSTSCMLNALMRCFFKISVWSYPVNRCRQNVQQGGERPSRTSQALNLGMEQEG